MANASEMFEQLLVQEKALELASFSPQDALKLGLLLNEKSSAYTKPIAIQITVNGHIIFKYCQEGATPDNSAWLQRKHNMVLRRQMSALRAYYYLEMRGQKLTDWLVNPDDYAACGGGYPIRIKNTGIIGTICVSGLAHHDDHQLIVDCLQEYFGL